MGFVCLGTVLSRMKAEMIEMVKMRDGKEEGRRKMERKKGRL